MHDLTEYYKHIFTLKNGVQIEIFTESSWKDMTIGESFTDVKRITIDGFVLTPQNLIVYKTVTIVKSEIIVQEEIKEKYIAVCPWPVNELEPTHTEKLVEICKTVAEMKVAAFEKYGTKDNTIEDFSVGVQVKVITPCEDHNFFYGETGKVVHSLEGIEVEFDVPRKFQDGTIQKSFYFVPRDLITVFDFERLNEKCNTPTSL